MEEKTFIFVLQLKNSLGFWEVQGEAFHDEREAGRRVDVLTAELAFELASHEELVDMYANFDWDNKVDYERFLCAVEEDPHPLYAWAETYAEGGAYSYEKVSLKGNTPSA
jgi:hypothetical protein